MTTLRAIPRRGGFRPNSDPGRPLSVLRADLDRAHVLTARGADGLSHTREALQALQLLLAKAKSDPAERSALDAELRSAVEALRTIAGEASVSGTGIHHGVGRHPDVSGSSRPTPRVTRSLSTRAGPSSSAGDRGTASSRPRSIFRVCRQSTAPARPCPAFSGATTVDPGADAFSVPAKRARRHECRCHRWRRRAGCHRRVPPPRLPRCCKRSERRPAAVRSDGGWRAPDRDGGSSHGRERGVRSRRRCRARSTRRWAVAGCGSPPGRTARSPSPRPAGSGRQSRPSRTSPYRTGTDRDGHRRPQSPNRPTVRRRRPSAANLEPTMPWAASSVRRRQHRSAAPADRRPRRRSGRLRNDQRPAGGVTDTTSMAAAINAAISRDPTYGAYVRRHRRRRRGRRLPEDQRQHPGSSITASTETAPPSAIAVCAPDRRAEPRR